MSSLTGITSPIRNFTPGAPSITTFKVLGTVVLCTWMAPLVPTSALHHHRISRECEPLTSKWSLIFAQDPEAVPQTKSQSLEKYLWALDDLTASSTHSSFLIFKFYFIFIGVELICNIVLVSVIQQNDSGEIFFPYRFLKDIEFSSLCCTVGYLFYIQ